MGTFEAVIFSVIVIVLLGICLYAWWDIYS